MKGALIALLIGAVLLVFFCFTLEIYRGKATIDVHWRDTFFVLSYPSAAVFVVLFLGTFFSTGGIIGTHFKSVWFVLLGLLFLSADTYCVVHLYRTLHNREIHKS